MNPVLEEILSTSRVRLPSGESAPVASQIDRACGELLQEVIAEMRPGVAVEIGLAFGVSTLYRLDALAACGARRLMGIDPGHPALRKTGEDRRRWDHFVPF